MLRFSRTSNEGIASERFPAVVGSGLPPRARRFLDLEVLACSQFLEEP